MRITRKEIDSVANEIYQLFVANKYHTLPDVKFSDIDPSTKKFYRTVAVWHLERLHEEKGE